MRNDEVRRTKDEGLLPPEGFNAGNAEGTEFIPPAEGAEDAEGSASQRLCVETAAGEEATR